MILACVMLSLDLPQCVRRRFRRDKLLRRTIPLKEFVECADAAASESHHETQFFVSEVLKVRQDAALATDVRVPVSTTVQDFLLSVYVSYSENASGQIDTGVRFEQLQQLCVDCGLRDVLLGETSTLGYTTNPSSAANWFSANLEN